jgi:hypothetical protein
MLQAAALEAANDSDESGAEEPVKESVCIINTFFILCQLIWCYFNPKI